MANTWVAVALELQQQLPSSWAEQGGPLMYLLSKLSIYSGAAPSSGFWQEKLWKSF